MTREDAAGRPGFLRGVSEEDGARQVEDFFDAVSWSGDSAPGDLTVEDFFSALSGGGSPRPRREVRPEDLRRD